jgi:putative membrane protein
MNNSPQIDWSVPQRQSLAALFIILYKIVLRILKNFWWVIVIYFFRNRRNEFDSFEMAIIGLSILSLLGSVIEFIYFKFYIQNDDLIIKQGFFTKKTITLPLNKIQAVHIEQTLLHSMLNAARLSFDSAGSENLEVKIDAIKKRDAEDFKRFILHSRRDVSTEEQVAAPEQVLVELSANDLARLSISANHLEALLLMLAFFFSAINQLKDVFDIEYNRVMNWLYQLDRSPMGALVAGSIAALMVSVIVSTVRVVFKYYDFRISKTESGFFIHTGLTNIQEKLVPFSKIQFISWKANWIRQQMRLYLLNFHAVGYNELKDKLRIRIPVTHPKMIPVLLQQYHNLLPTGQLLPYRIHPAYVGRRPLLVGILPAVIIMLAGFYFFKWTILWVLLWIAVTGIAAILFQRKFRLWVDTEALQIRRGFLGIEELVLRWDMVQSVAMEQSIYQEGKQLATVVLNTAGGQVRIPYIHLPDAREIINYALYKAETAK